MEFLSPQYLSEAFEILDRRGKELKIAAGMTHILRFHTDFPQGLSPSLKAILHIGNLEVLSDIREENQKYGIGSTATLSSLAADSYLARYAPAILDAVLATSTPQIRNRRTVGGEIGWGSFHSPLIVTLMALGAKVRVRFQADTGENNHPGREDSVDLMEFYEGQLERTSSCENKQVTRSPRSKGQHLIMKVAIPDEMLHRGGTFSFFRGLRPKISMENSGVVLAVHGYTHQGVIQSAHMVASGLWLDTLSTKLPLEGVRMGDTYIFEKLYSFCDRYSFDKYRREGPSGAQLGLVVFGLLKEGFSHLMGN